ncbi:hypothetical protein NW767_005936 [Fusarium falciforme]|nr:hypothetical protein NW767_005936 [Fusarium falciforme]KAJ4253635.1 hypothetical protein NW757_005589 [Fusarium falciforme]
MADILVEPVPNAQDFTEAFACIAAAFGRQTRDGIWIAMNPGWDTPEGEAAGIKRLVDRWSSVTRNRDGDLNTVFLKATVPGTDGHRVIAGFAIWQQCSVVEGYGDPQPEDFSKVMNLDTLYPGNKAEQRYLVQLDRSLHGRRIEVIKEKATASPPAVMVFDLCVVDPAHQRKGIAQRLVQWGLDEAKRRGGLEAITEASSMGRKAYIKMGFQPEGDEMVYHVDPEFKDRDLPSNLFMRTGGQ